MARLQFSGFEANDVGLVDQISKTTSGSGTATTDSVSPITGGFSLKLDSGASNGTASSLSANITIVLPTTLNGKSSHKFDNLPTTACKVASWQLSSDIISARLTTAGKLQLWNETGTPAQIGSDSSATIAAGETHYIEIAINVASGAADVATLKLDGVQVATASSLSLSDSTGFWKYLAGWVGAPGANLICHVDDIIVNDDSGANENSFPGNQKVLLLLPTSDNARATLWTGGVGGTTNLFDAVNNTPPIGTATETDLTQIEHGGSSGGTTDAYDANMTTYAAAGIGAADTVNVIQPVIAHGEDIATGTKLLTFSVVSNPAIAAIANFSAGADAGALATYPTTWTITRGNISYQPAVTVGTAPVMRVTRPETVARVASVCFMGMLVSYTPAVSSFPLVPHMASNNMIQQRNLVN